MTTARPGLPYPCSPRPRLGASLLGGGSNVTGYPPLENTLVQRISGILSACNMQISNSKLCESMLSI